MPKRILYAGTILNGFQILEDLPSKNGISIVKAICPLCGKEFEGRPKTIKNGECKSCGCLKLKASKENLKKAQLKQAQNKPCYKGQTINDFYILDDIPRPEKDTQKTSWVKAVCPICNQSFDVRVKDIKSGNTKSCGCTKSHGEFKINKILTEANISFAKEFSFNDLKYIKKLRFDFAIFNDKQQLSYLIEYDGKQHFEIINAGWSNFDSLEIIQKRDGLKNNYCKEHNIPLIRIPYTHLKELCLKDLLLETTEFRYC